MFYTGIHPEERLIALLESMRLARPCIIIVLVSKLAMKKFFSKESGGSSDQEADQGIRTEGDDLVQSTFLY